MDSMNYAIDKKVSTDLDYEMASFDPVGNNVVIMSIKIPNKKGKNMILKEQKKSIKILKSGSNSEWTQARLNFVVDHITCMKQTLKVLKMKI